MRAAIATFLLSFMAPPALAQAKAPDGGPYVPTPPTIAARMLTLAEVGPRDYVIDLGSGDGRLVITAVANYKARGGTGIEIDAALVKQSQETAKKLGVADRVTFVAGDLFAARVEQATVVTLSLLEGILGAVEAKLGRELKPGTRVISHDYSLPGWKHVDVVTFESDEKIAITGVTRTVLYLYRVPEAR